MFVNRRKDPDTTEPKRRSHSSQLLQKKVEECEDLKRKLEDVKGRLESIRREYLQLQEDETKLQRLYDQQIGDLQYAQKWVDCAGVKHDK